MNNNNDSVNKHEKRNYRPVIITISIVLIGAIERSFQECKVSKTLILLM